MLPLILSVILFTAGDLGERIWRSECAGKVEGLTTWNEGEGCASLGIGHFIWYPAEKRGPFTETFPALLAFLVERGATPPAWLQEAKGCPWPSREAFQQAQYSDQMRSLRTFLFDTRALQAEFIAQRLERVLPRLVAACSPEEGKRITAVFKKLRQTPGGLYALIDYVHFKGEGISPTERYQGQGWGLLQVLQRLSPTSGHLLADFSQTAATLLTERVAHAPPDRHEERWLKGWLNRVKGYGSSG